MIAATLLHPTTSRARWTPWKCCQDVAQPPDLAAVIIIGAQKSSNGCYALIYSTDGYASASERVYDTARAMGRLAMFTRLLISSYRLSFSDRRSM